MWEKIILFSMASDFPSYIFVKNWGGKLESEYTPTLTVEYNVSHKCKLHMQFKKF